MSSDGANTVDGLPVEYTHAKADKARREREANHPRYRKLIDDAIERAKAARVRPVLTLLSRQSGSDARARDFAYTPKRESKG